MKSAPSVVKYMHGHSLKESFSYSTAATHPDPITELQKKIDELEKELQNQLAKKETTHRTWDYNFSTDFLF